jgi:hypothetical protein
VQLTVSRVQPAMATALGFSQSVPFPDGMPCGYKVCPAAHVGHSGVWNDGMAVAAGLALRCNLRSIQGAFRGEASGNQLAGMSNTLFFHTLVRGVLAGPTSLRYI